MKENPYVLPENFRGGDPDSGVVNCLEDVYYEKHEHSLIYNPEASALAEDAEFEGDPNITWETKRINEDGTEEVLESNNTNMAADGGTFFDPGHYQVGNHGARQVAEGDGGAADTEDEEGDDGEGAEGEDTEDVALVDAEGDTEGEGGGSKTVTAEQNMGVKVHDCTSPDMWVAFQEGAGSVDMAETEEVLKQEMAEKIIANLGRPFSTKEEDYEEASYLFLDEGKQEERDVEPWNKTARLSIAGPLFNDKGAVKFESGIVNAGQDEENFKTKIHVSGESDEGLSGVYVRRNVPFIFAAMAIDNGDGRASLGEVACKLEYADGTDVEKTDNGYMFRVPNYPREQYQDQPEYVFVAVAKDKDGNASTIRMPLFVVDTKASFQGGQNQ
jgi:hypothetical protein